MGKKRIATIEAGGAGKKTKQKPPKEKPKKIKVAGLKGGERVVLVEAEPLLEAEKETGKGEKKASEKKRKPPKIRGKKYKAAKAKTGPNKVYPLPEAIKLVKSTSVARFDGSVEVHLKVTDLKIKGKIMLPYFQAKAKKVRIADEKLLATLEKGKLDFDVLLATPSFMPKLAKYARILGPKGLMPNPKNGTIVKDPKKVLSSFEKPSLSFKTEKDQPLIHTVIGKVSQPEKELEENLKALVAAINPKRIKKAVITSTMGPAVKVDLSSALQKG